MTACLPAEHLEQLLEEPLADHEQEEVQAHVATCLPAEPARWPAVRAKGPVPPPASRRTRIVPPHSRT
jgi:hypothetical protein